MFKPRDVRRQHAYSTLPAETMLNNLPPRQGTAMSSWHPEHPPYTKNLDQQPPPQDLGHHRSDPPPLQYHLPPSMEGPGCSSDSAYSRQGSVSAPTRCPAEAQQPRYPPPPPSGTSHEHPYYRTQAYLSTIAHHMRHQNRNQTGLILPFMSKRDLE